MLLRCACDALCADFLPALYPPPPLGRSRFDCAHQGLSEGWSDLYAKDLDCQWIDITDVPAGQRCSQLNSLWLPR